MLFAVYEPQKRIGKRFYLLRSPVCSIKFEGLKMETVIVKLEACFIFKALGITRLTIDRKQNRLVCPADDIHARDDCVIL